jgi:hypothetical protein
VEIAGGAKLNGAGVHADIAAIRRDARQVDLHVVRIHARRRPGLAVVNEHIADAIRVAWREVRGV